ncbi:MAG: ribosomal protein S18-alanine N-acetyltransferase [Acidobacteriota bacterium]
MADIDVTLATVTDVDAVFRIESESFPVPWRREFFENELQATGRLNLVAKKEGRVVAYVFAMWYFDEMHVNKIAVAPDWRRLRIAEALMARCIAFAGKQKITSISLEVRTTNDSAQAFYRHLGFIPTYTRPRYYPDGESAVVMTLILGDSITR